MNFWIVMEIDEENPDGADKSIGGVFEDRDAAIAACHTVNHYIAPLPVNEDFGVEDSYWESMHFPLAPERDQTS